MEAIWQRLSDVLREKIGSQNFEMWFGSARLASVSDGRAVVEVPNKFFVEWIQENYADVLQQSLREACGESAALVALRANPGRQGELFPGGNPSGGISSGGNGVTEPVAAEGQRRTRLGTLIPRYTFANFVVGASNKFAHAAAEAVANRPGEHYNPLFIYGGVGLGKTHLINAIGQRVLERNAAAKVGYFSAEAFMNELIQSIRRSRMDEFKNRFRKLDVLILDDVQFIAGKEQTQVEFFHTFNTLHESHRQIVLSSDKFPKDIPHLEARLRSRFEWGLVADIQAPDIETRVAILLRKAEADGLHLSRDVALFLASKFEANIRELEGSLARLGAFASMVNRPITVEFAKEVLKNLVRDRVPQLTVEQVQQLIASEFHVTVADLKSRKRTKNLANARQIAMYLSRELIEASFPNIGQKFDKDHSTVFHAVEVIRRRRKDDPTFRSSIEILEQRLRSRSGL